MPVIAYKTLDLKVHYVQARRILCEYCRTPFTYVFGEQKTFNVTGVPLISSDEGMQQAAMKNAAKSLSKIARAPNKGEAICPNCKRYQGWMVRHSRAVGFGCGFLGGLGIAGAIAIAVGIWFMWERAILPITIGGAILGLVIGKWWALDRGPHPDKDDERSLMDDEVPQLLAQCEQEGYDPFLYWYLSLGNEPKEDEAVISLGVHDTSSRPKIFPHELSSDTKVRELQQL